MKINYEEDAELPLQNDEGLTYISDLVKEQIDLTNEIELIEQDLKDKKALLRDVQEVRLVEALRNLNMEELRTTNGYDVKIKQQLFASIAQKNKEKASAWLIENGLSSLVKESVGIDFDKGDVENAHKAIKMLIEAGFEPKSSSTVNTAQVKSAIKELREQGIDVPLELFGAYDRTWVEIKKGS